MTAQQSTDQNDERPKSPFRGYWSILEVKDRVVRLTAFLKVHRPACRELTLKGADYDLVRRWPAASRLHGFEVADDGMSFDGYRLRRDTAPARYKRA